MPICGGGLSSRVRKGLTITLREVSRGSSLPLLLGIPPLIGLMSLGLQCVEWLNLNGTFSVPSASSHIGHVMRQKASCSSSFSLLMLAMLPCVSDRHGVPDAACSAAHARRKASVTSVLQAARAARGTPQCASEEKRQRRCKASASKHQQASPRQQAPAA